MLFPYNGVKTVRFWERGTRWGLNVFVIGFLIGVLMQLCLEYNFRAPGTAMSIKFLNSTGYNFRTPGTANSTNALYQPTDRKRNRQQTNVRKRLKWGDEEDCHVIGEAYLPQPQFVATTRNKNDPTNQLELEGFQNEEIGQRKRNTSRLLCLIEITGINFKLAHAINNTWGKRCDKLVFFGDSNKGIKKGLKRIKFKKRKQSSWAGKAFNLNFQTSWDKTESIWRIAHKRYLSTFDWFLKVDDDAYVVVENLKQHLKHYDSSLPLYSGHTFQSKKGICAKSRPGYVLSREGLRRVIMNLKKNTGLHNSKTNWELLSENSDRRLVSCIRDAGLLIIADRDSLNRQRFILDGLVDSIMKYDNRTGKIVGFDCCSDQAVAFPIGTHKQMYTTDFYLYQLRAFGVGRMIVGQGGQLLQPNPTKHRNLSRSTIQWTQWWKQNFSVGSAQKRNSTSNPVLLK